MKKFLKSIKELMLRHKLLSIICFLAFIIIMIMMYIFFNLFVGGNDKYGNRLDGINKVSISSSEQKEVASFLEEKGEVTEASVRIQGKIIYINIIFTRDTSIDKAKEIATEVLDQFDKDEKAFYDIGYFLTQENLDDSEDKGFYVTGSKNAKLDTISWIKS